VKNSRSRGGKLEVKRGHRVTREKGLHEKVNLGGDDQIGEGSGSAETGVEGPL